MMISGEFVVVRRLKQGSVGTTRLDIDRSMTLAVALAGLRSSSTDLLVN